VNKELVNLERETLRPKRVVRMGLTGSRGGAMMPYTTLREGPPIVIDREEFRYSYKCEHCGHEWSEKHVEKRRER
jgi:hypothetical protein